MTKYYGHFIVTCAIAFAIEPSATAQTAITLPPIPPNLQVPAGNVVFLKGFAAGTQNYVCVPGPEGPFWKFLGPQATLFLTFPWLGGEGKQQIATHFLSSNPVEGGTARPTWQHSLDTSAVWGRALASSTDSKYVAPGAIPWLLVEIVGTQRGPLGGSALTRTTYIHRLNTSGGVAPSTGCEASAYGTVALAPYTTDYYFYQQEK